MPEGSVELGFWCAPAPSPHSSLADPGRWDRYYGSRFRDPRTWDRRYWYDADYDPHRKESYAYSGRSVPGHTCCSLLGVLCSICLWGPLPSCDSVLVHRRPEKGDDHWRYDPRFTGSFDEDTEPHRDPYGEEADRRSEHSEHSAQSLHSAHSLHSRRSSLSSHSHQVRPAPHCAQPIRPRACGSRSPLPLSLFQESDLQKP